MSVVSINAVMGEGGIIEQAKHAAEMTANSTTAEQEELNRLEAEFANVVNGKIICRKMVKKNVVFPTFFELVKTGV